MQKWFRTAVLLVLTGLVPLVAEESYSYFQDGRIMKAESGEAMDGGSDDPEFRLFAESAGLILADPASLTTPGWGGSFSLGGVCNLMPDSGQSQDNHWLEAGVLSLVLGGSAYGIALALGGEQDAAIPVGLIAALYTFPNTLRYGAFSEEGAVACLGGMLAGMGSYFGGGFLGMGTYVLAHAASYIAGVSVGSSTGYRFTYEETPSFNGFKLKPYYTLDLESLGIGSGIGRYSFWTGFRHRYASLPGFVLNGVSYTASGDGQWDYAPEAFLAVRLFDVLLLQGGLGGMKIYERDSSPKRPLADFIGWKDLSYSLSAGLNWRKAGLGYTYRVESKSQSAGEVPADVYVSDGQTRTALGYARRTHTVSGTALVTDWISLYAQVSYASVDYRVYAITTEGVIGSELSAIAGDYLTAKIGMRVEIGNF